MARKSRKYTGQEVNASKVIKYTTWGYARISEDDENSSNSIESQIAIINNYANDKADIVLRDVITDVGFTGTNFRRPGYEKLMDGIKRGEVECVAVKDLSRLGRAYIEVGELLFNILPVYRVRFISVNDNYDSFADDSSRKKLMVLFKNLMNHMFSRDTSKKARSAHDLKKQRGELAGLTPYGYIRGDDGKQLVPDGDAALVVQRIFNMRLSGQGVRSIARQLTEEGIPSPQNRRYTLGRVKSERFAKPLIWNPTVISKILTYETYTGVVVQGKHNCNLKILKPLPKEQWIRHENAHPAIISKEKFAQVQVLLKEANQHSSKRNETPWRTENRYVGKTFCAACGYAALRGTTTYFCGRCNVKIKKESGMEKFPGVPVNTLDKIVISSLRQQMDAVLDTAELVNALSKPDFNQRQAGLLQDKANYSKTIADSDKMLSSSYVHHLSGILDLREFEIIRAQVESDKQLAEARLAKIEDELRQRVVFQDRHAYWHEMYLRFRYETTPTKDLIQSLIQRIEITPLTNEVHIIFNYSDELVEFCKLLDGSGVGDDV